MKLEFNTVASIKCLVNDGYDKIIKERIFYRIMWLDKLHYADVDDSDDCIVIEKSDSTYYSAESIKKSKISKIIRTWLSSRLELVITGLNEAGESIMSLNVEVYTEDDYDDWKLEVVISCEGDYYERRSLSFIKATEYWGDI